MGIDTCNTIDNWQKACGDDNLASFYETDTSVLKKFETLTINEASHFNDVLKFHVKFDQLNHSQPVHLTKRKLLERIKFMQEELNEFTKACGITPGYHDQDGNYFPEGYTNNGDDQDMLEMADGLVDLVYVALGTAVMMGLPWAALWDDVQRANMAKERGIGHRGNLVDCVKPPGWEPPKTLEILQSAGYEGPTKFVDDQIYMSGELATTLQDSGDGYGIKDPGTQENGYE